MPGFVDTHCHLSLADFANDLDQVIALALEAGVEKILVPAVDLESSFRAVQLAHAYPQLYAAVGVHPEAGQNYSKEQIGLLEKLATDERVVAVGEIGLDFHYPPVEVDLQKRIFEDMLELAARVGKPVLVHSRDSIETVFQTLNSWVDRLFQQGQAHLFQAPGILHAFEGDLDQANQAIQLHFAIGVGGPITYKNARLKQIVAKNVGLDHIVLETDAPYLPPHPFRGTRNEPAHIKEIAEKLSELKNQPLELIAATTTDTAQRILHWEG